MRTTIKIDHQSAADSEGWCGVHPVVEELWGNDEANANFIVRACNSHAELLEACQRLVKLYRTNPRLGHEAKMQRDDLGCLVVEAEAAIAKAEG